MPALIDLDTRERRFHQLVAKGDPQAALAEARAVRLACRRSSRSVPEWALPARSGRSRALAKAPVRVAAAVATLPPLPELPAELRHWRAYAGDRAVIMHGDGRVTLRIGSVLAGTAREATFASVAEAVAAVSPAISWRKLAAAEARRQLY